MRLIPQLIAALVILPGVLAVDQTKSAIVWFEDKNTPDSVFNEAKNSIIKSGGKITHVYTIIRGFAVVAPEKALKIVQTLGGDHAIRIEEDEMVSIQN